MTTEEKQTEKVWFVTGASKGLGAELIKRSLVDGHKVIATSRKKQSLIDLVGEQESFFPLNMDVTSNADVKEAIIKGIGRVWTDRRGGQ